MKLKVLFLSLLLLCISSCASKDPNFMKSDYKPKELGNGKAIVIGTAHYKTFKKGLANFGYAQQQSLFGIAASAIHLAKDGKIAAQPVNNIATLTFERQSGASDTNPKLFTLGNLYGEDYEIDSYDEHYDFATITPGIYKLTGISTFDYNGVNPLFGTREGILNIVKFPPPANTKSYFEVKASEVLYIGDIVIQNAEEKGKNESIGYNNLEVATLDKSNIIRSYVGYKRKFKLLQGKVQFEPLKTESLGNL